MSIPEITYDELFKIVIFGDSGVGKTTLLIRAETEYIFDPTHSITIGVECPIKELIVNEKKIKLQIWNISAAERFKFIISSYVRGASGGIFIYDIGDSNSLAHIDEWLEIVRREVNYSFPIIVVGCKTDLEEREVSTEEGLKIAESRGLDGFLECSSKTGENVEKVFKKITKKMLQNSDSY